jgi:glucokinase
MSGETKPRGGIDLGGTKIQTAIVAADGKVLGEARRPTPTDGGPAGVAEQMAEALREAATAAGLEPAALEGVGVGSPGDADEKTGVVSSAKNLPDWEGSFPLAEALQTSLGTEVRVGNDVQVATEAEFHLGAGREFESLIGVFWGTGVGGGLVLDGKPWLGRGAAGEIGHVVVKRGGARCPCGRKGCMEAYAGRSAMEAEARREHEDGHKTDLFKLMEKHGKPRLTSGIWERALDHGDQMATKLIDRAIEALGTGVASAVNLIDPEAIIIGGGLGIRFGERFMDPLMDEMSKHLFLDQKPPAVRVAARGDHGGAVGASLLFAR